MSDQVEAKPDNTAEAETKGQEETAISTAEAAAAEAKPAEAVLAEEAPAEEKTVFSEGAESEEEKPAEEKPDGDKPDDEKPEEEEEEDGEKSAIEQALSEVELPEGISVSEEDQAALAEVAEAHKLSKDALKDLIGFQTKREQQRMEKIAETQKEFIGKMKSEAQKLPKETLVAANRFVQKFGSDKLKAKMGDPKFYIGNDVDIINAFAIAQKAVDGGFVDGSAAGGGAEKSAGEVLYD